MDPAYLARDFAAFVARRGIHLSPTALPAAGRRPRDDEDDARAPSSAPCAKRPRPGGGGALAGYARAADSGVAAHVSHEARGAPGDSAAACAGSAPSFGYSSAPSLYGSAPRFAGGAGAGEAPPERTESASTGVAASAATTGSLGFSCGVCGRTFARKGVLKKHVEAVHDGVRSFCCDHCNACFGLKSDLKRHTMSVHLKQRPYECGVCDASFGRRSDLKRHSGGVHGHGDGDEGAED